MNHDGLLSQLTDDKLILYHNQQQHQSASAQTADAVEEEQAATIHTIPVPHRSGGSKSEASTPLRKVSTSRFMTAFSQFYTGNNTLVGPSVQTTAAATVSPIVTDDEPSPSSSTGRTPTKGMESKLLSMWHNVKYGWSGKIRSNFSKEQPVWLLGRCYHRKCTPPSSMESSAELTVNSENKLSNLIPPVSSQDQYRLQVDEILVPQELGMDAVENQVADNPWEEGIDGFKRDFYSRIWMTYRREFPIMNGSNYTSDCGWGCMLRSGQMLLAQGLICHFLGRSWRYDPDTQLHSTYEDNMHKKIIKWFGDSSSKNSPFSIHALVSLGQEMGKKPGDWYGPSSVSYLLRQAVKNAAQENADFDNIVIYVSKNCTIYTQDIHDECTIPEQPSKHNVPWQNHRKLSSNGGHISNKTGSSQLWKSLIILIPLRLGTVKLNVVYAHCIKLLLSTEYCIGIIGGRPKHSLYFVGFQEDKLIHLDPHYCQEMVDVNQENFPLHSFHCKSPRKLKTSKMDPSCCIGFYCQTKTDYDNFVESVQLYLHPMRCASGSIEKSASTPNATASGAISEGNNTSQFAEMNYPLFTFSRGRCVDQAKDEPHESIYKPLQRQLVQMRQELCGSSNDILDDDDGETEEFVIL